MHPTSSLLDLHAQAHRRAHQLRRQAIREAWATLGHGLRRLAAWRPLARGH